MCPEHASTAQDAAAAVRTVLRTKRRVRVRVGTCAPILCALCARVQITGFLCIGKSRVVAQTGLKHTVGESLLTAAMQSRYFRSHLTREYHNLPLLPFRVAAAAAAVAAAVQLTGLDFLARILRRHRRQPRSVSQNTRRARAV